MSLIDEVYSNIKERKHNVETGKINGIPFPLKGLRKYIPSIERGNYLLLVGASKSGKTQLSNFLILYNSILYSYENQEKLSVKFIMFPLEEGKEMTLCRFMSYILYTKYNIRISPTDMMSSNPEKPLPNDILSIMESKPFMDIINYFTSCVQFEEANTSVGIDVIVKNYAKSHGETIYSEETFTDEDGNERHKIIGYKPKDPNEYVFVLIDNANLIVPTKEEKTILVAITNLSKYLVKYFTRYNYICVLLQQLLDSEINSMEAVKNDNILPSKASLKDCKSSGNDATIVLGISNPGSLQNLTTRYGYDLLKLKRKYLRIVNIIFQRFGEGEVIAPLYFDGAVNYYQDAPKPNDTEKMDKIYESIEQIEKGNTKRFIINTLIRILKRRKNGTTNQKKRS